MLCIKGLITDLTMYLPAGAIYKEKRIDFNKIVKRYDAKLLILEF